MTMTHEQLDAAREGIRAVLAAMPPREPTTLPNDEADNDDVFRYALEATWLDMDAQLATVTVKRDVSSPTYRLLSEVGHERWRQDDKWGEQNHRPLVWLAILGVEFGEACKEANEGVGWTDYRRELIQVAAVAVPAAGT